MFEKTRTETTKEKALDKINDKYVDFKIFI